MHQALYRKWRPKTFDDVYGQEHITSVLRYEAEHQAFSHAYLFCGSRGTGKTTCAKILAKVVNCEHPVGGNPCGECAACRAIENGSTTDVLEMDAASNNGVDNIRDIRDEVAYAPSTLKYRVYIIDEVHMLSVSAFNALLKTLEEPPEYVVFILATTELQKLPATIISRCQRFDFRRIATEDLVKRLSFIADQENIKLHPDAARILAKLAQGGMRDAISLLELCAGGNSEITPESVRESVGIAGRDAMIETVKAIAQSNYDALFAQIDEVVRSSKDLSVFWQDLISLYRDLLVIRSTSNASAYLDLTDSETEQLTATAHLFSKETLLYHCKLLENALFSMQKANAVKRIVAELTLVRMCDETLDLSNEALLSRISKLEDRVAVGGFVRVPESGKTAPETEKATEAPLIRKNKSPEPPPKPEPLQKRVLHPMRNWMEAVERTSIANPMAGAFLKSASAFTTDAGEVIVRFPNAFSSEMALKGEGRETLRMTLSAILRREVPDQALFTEVVGNREQNALDEIIEAADESTLI